jgi:hypothetical protein
MIDTTQLAEVIQWVFGLGFFTMIFIALVSAFGGK